jgi:hypothetical protein
MVHAHRSSRAVVGQRTEWPKTPEDGAWLMGSYTSDPDAM